jgi:hypothetical protein
MTEACSAEPTAPNAAAKVAYFRVRSDGYTGSITSDELAAGFDWDDEFWRGRAFFEHAVAVTVDVPVDPAVQLALPAPQAA